MRCVQNNLGAAAVSSVLGWSGCTPGFGLAVGIVNGDVVKDFMGVVCGGVASSCLLVRRA